MYIPESDNRIIIMARKPSQISTTGRIGETKKGAFKRKATARQSIAATGGGKKKVKSAKGMSLSQIQAQLDAYNKKHKSKKNKRIS